MEIEQMLSIIRKGEGLNSEFKRATASIPQDAFETVVSFSNTEGGILLLGVEDDGTITGIDQTLKNQMLKNLVSALNATDCISPPLYLQPTAVDVNDKTIIVLQVPVSSQIHEYKGRVYIREFESDVDITRNQQRISDLYLSKRNVFTESQIIPYLSMDDLDKSLFEKARNLIRSNKSDHPWLTIDDLAMLREAMLWRKDFMGSGEGFTLASALIFGKETTIQSILPAYKTEAMVRRENTDRWDDRITLRKNLIETYQELKAFINRHLPEKFYLEGDQRIDLRDKIFREIIGNVVVHREYSSALATEIIIGNYDLTATNPNKPHFYGPIDLDSFNPYPKNPNIRKFFTALGWTDEIGSGIRNTKKYLPLYVKGAKPLFIEDVVFKAVMPLIRHTLQPFSSQWLSWLDLSEKHAEHFDLALSRIDLSPTLQNADWEELLLHLVPGWHKKGTRLPKLDWPKNQAIDENEIKKVPGWTEKGTRLIHKKVRYLISVLMLSGEPINLEDMMEAIGYSNKFTFRTNYIKPLEQAKMISMTNPEALTSPAQKYKLTPIGMFFLGFPKNDDPMATSQ
jgi:ATP-dependent DNA helicase RecG